MNENDEKAKLQKIFCFEHMQGAKTVEHMIQLQDLQRLKPSVYLNDVLVNFYLKFIEKEVMSKQIQDQTLTLNSFFFDKLKRDVKHNGHINFDSVKTWNRAVKDLFSVKQYIFVPICENQHWLMACIVFPNRIEKLMKRKFQDLQDIEAKEAQEKALREMEDKKRRSTSSRSDKAEGELSQKRQRLDSSGNFEVKDGDMKPGS